MTARRTLFLFALFFIIPLTVFAAVESRDKNKSKDKTSVKDQQGVSSSLGLNIPQWGISVDAIFDPRLTDIIPGYHIVNLVLTNRRGEAIMLDALRDKWTIVDHLGKRRTAFNHVEQFDKKLWSQLPDRLKQMLDYPQALSPGKSITIDVFLPKDVSLVNFKEVIWKSQHFDKEFNMLTRYEDQLSVPNDKEFETPRDSVNVSVDENATTPPPLQESGPTLTYPYDTYDTTTPTSAEEQTTPQIGEVIEPNNTLPTFDPNLDDQVIVVK